MSEFSVSVDTLKQKLIDHMASMNFDHMSMMDLNSYVGILHKLHDMTRPDYMESVAALFKNGFGPSAPVCAESEVK